MSVEDQTHWLTARTGIVPTPPPATRHSGTRLWDEAARPTAPEPAADVRFTRPGLATGRHLIEVHDMFRRELTELRGLLDRVRDGGADIGDARARVNAMALRSNSWALGSHCQAYCFAVTQHHGHEDALIFPHLRRRDPSLAPVIDRLEAEHHVIHDLLDAVDRALVTLAREPDDLAPLREAVDALTDALLSHLSYEERELVGPLALHGFH